MGFWPERWAMTERALKPGWKTWRFDQMAINFSDLVEPSDVDLDHYVGLEHLDPDSLKIRRWGEPSDVEATKLRFREGDIIFGRRRVYQRKLAVAEFDGICSAHAMVLRPKTDVVLPEFLPFFMQSDLFMNRALEISVGSLSPTINWRTLARQEFALPSLTEQRRVAEVLLASAEMIESYRSLANTSERQYLSLVLHIFQVGVRDSKLDEYKHFRYPAHWELRRVDECFELQLGKMSSAKARAGDNQKLYLKNNNVLWGKFDFANLSSMSFNESEQEKFALEPGDLLVCEGGEIGRAAIWNNEYPGLFYQKALHRLRPRSQEYSNCLLMHYLRYCSLRGILNSVATGTAILHLPEEQLAALVLPFPPPEEQQEMAMILEGALEAIELAENRVEQDLERHKALLSMIFEV
jgi:type I restriction enzyme S subunit